MSEPSLVVRKINQWNKPVPLMQKIKNSEEFADFTLKQVGWVWNKEAYLVNNFALGWIAIVDDQNPKNLHEKKLFRCDHRNREFLCSKRDKLKEYKKVKSVLK